MPPRTCDIEAGTRTCGRCGETLPASPEFFHKHPAAPDGCASKCKACTRAYGKQRYDANPDPAKEYSRAWLAANPERKAENQRKWRERNPERSAEINREYAAENPEKVRAQHAVNDAIRRNRLAKPTHCEDCNKEARLHGHHSDYTRPLEVNWLCPLCHSARHKKTRITHETLPQPTAQGDHHDNRLSQTSTAPALEA